MDLPREILRDLLISPSTASSIAGRFDVSDDEALAVLQGNEIAGTVESYPIKCLTVFRLTPNGETLAKTYPPSTSSLISDS